mgnify:CR=1 FL=1
MNREQIKKVLEDKFQSLTTYEDKLIFLYMLIMQSQRYYLEYSGKIKDLNLNDILAKANYIHNDNDFIDFIDKEILDKLNLGHLHLKLNEKVNFDLFHETITQKYTNISDYMLTSIKTLKEFSPYIKNSFKFHFNNGFIEGNNNFIKVIKRIAFGFRSFRRFKARIMICKGLFFIKKEVAI